MAGTDRRTKADLLARIGELEADLEDANADGDGWAERYGEATMRRHDAERATKRAERAAEDAAAKAQAEIERERQRTYRAETLLARCRRLADQFEMTAQSKKLPESVRATYAGVALALREAATPAPNTEQYATGGTIKPTRRTFLPNQEITIQGKAAGLRDVMLEWADIGHTEADPFTITPGTVSCDECESRTS